MSKALDRLSYCEKALELKKDIEGNFLVLAEYLYYIQDRNLFESQWTDFDEFLEEMKMTKSTAFKLTHIYKTFILGYGFTSKEINSAGGISSLSDIIPMVNSKKTAEKWLHLTTTLTRSDLRKEIKEAKTGVTMANCKHGNTYKVQICKDCGERWQII